MQHSPALEALAGERVVVDVEGNGQQPPEVVELAVVAIEDGVLGTPRSWLVRPQRPITTLITRKVHGISNADVADAPSFAVIRVEVQDLLAESWFAAHNARTEQGVLTPLLPDWRPQGVLDALRLARALWPRRPRYSLDALVRQESLDLSPVAATSRPHRTAYDAYATALLLLRLLDALGPVELPLEQLAAMSSAAAPDARRPPDHDQPAQQESLWTGSTD
jgi:exodeoxyribonuclease X